MTVIPIVYNLHSVRVRWVSAIVAVLGIAGTVGVFVAMLAMGRGFQATLVRSGSPQNAMVRRAGATSEMDSSVGLEQLRVIEDTPGVLRNGAVTQVSPEVMVVASLPLRSTGTDANVPVRGLTPRALEVHPGVKLVAGRFFQPGLSEVVIGKNAARSYAGLDFGRPVQFGGLTWTIVGVLDAGGSAFDSEIWCDVDLLKRAYHLEPGAFSSVTARLVSPSALDEFRRTLAGNPRLNVQVDSEVEYYEKESRQLTEVMVTLGSLVAAIMGLGAVFAALNTMYSAVAERTREVATLRALGFGGSSVVLSFMVEALFIALVGGLLGCLAVLPINGLTTGTMNWQTFSHLAFAFRITPALLALGVAFALAMGLLGGVFPAVRAARLPVAAALRDL